MLLMFDKLKSTGYTPDKVTWNTLLSMCGRNGMHRHAARVFKEMKMDIF